MLKTKCSKRPPPPATAPANAASTVPCSNSRSSSSRAALHGRFVYSPNREQRKRRCQMRNLKRHEKTSQDCVGFRHPYLFSFGLFQHLPGNLQVDLSVKPPLPSSARIAPELQTPLAMHPVPGRSFGRGESLYVMPLKPTIAWTNWMTSAEMS